MDRSLKQTGLQRSAVSLALMLFIAGCNASGDPLAIPGTGDEERTPVVQPSGAGPGEDTRDHASQGLHSEPTTTPPDREPLVDLGTGVHLVNVRTGEADPLPRSITSISGAGNYEASPDGTMILFDNASRWAASDEPVERGLHQLWVANIDGSHVRRLTDDPLGASQGSWSPDGTKVVYLGGWARLCCWLTPAELMVVDVASGTTTRLAHGVARAFQAPFFSADGSEVLFTRHADPPWGGGQPQVDLWTIPVDGGRPEMLLEDRGYASYSPDGATIAFPRLVSWHEGNSFATYAEIWVSDPDGRDARRLVRSGGQVRWSPNGKRIYFRFYGPPNFSRGGLRILNMTTGRSILLSGGIGQDWIDDQTLIVLKK